MMSPMPALIRMTLAFAALGLAACGDSEEPTPALTREAFIARTEELCEASNARTRKLNADLQRAGAQARDDTQLMRRLHPILKRGYRAVRDNAAAFEAANPPPADAARIEKIRAAYDQQAELARKLTDAAKRGDAEQFRSLSAQQRAVSTRARRLARDYGFRECGSSKSDA